MLVGRLPTQGPSTTNFSVFTCCLNGIKPVLRISSVLVFDHAKGGTLNFFYHRGLRCADRLMICRWWNYPSRWISSPLGQLWPIKACWRTLGWGLDWGGFPPDRTAGGIWAEIEPTSWCFRWAIQQTQSSSNLCVWLFFCWKAHFWWRHLGFFPLPHYGYFNFITQHTHTCIMQQ